MWRNQERRNSSILPCYQDHNVLFPFQLHGPQYTANHHIRRCYYQSFFFSLVLLFRLKKGLIFHVVCEDKGTKYELRNKISY
jgi:hypothetical protein